MANNLRCPLIAKELEEIQAIEEEERNFKYHQDRNELIEW